MARGKNQIKNWELKWKMMPKNKCWDIRREKFKMKLKT